MATDKSLTTLLRAFQRPSNDHDASRYAALLIIRADTNLRLQAPSIGNNLTDSPCKPSQYNAPHLTATHCPSDMAACHRTSDTIAASQHVQHSRSAYTACG